MRYMLLIYTREDAIARSSQEEMQQVMNGHGTVTVTRSDKPKSPSIVRGVGHC